MCVCDAGNPPKSDDEVSLCLCSRDLVGDWFSAGFDESRASDVLDSLPLSSLDSEKSDEILFAIVEG